MNTRIIEKNTHTSQIKYAQAICKMGKKMEKFFSRKMDSKMVMAIFIAHFNSEVRDICTVQRTKEKETKNLRGWIVMW